MSSIIISQTTLDSILGRLSDMERSIKDNTADIKTLSVKLSCLEQEVNYIEGELDELS